MLTTLFVYDILEKQENGKRQFNHIIVVNAFDINGAERIVHERIGQWITESDHMDLSIRKMFETQTKEWDALFINSTLVLTDYRDTYGIIYENCKNKVLFFMIRKQSNISFIHIDEDFSKEAVSGFVIRKLVELSGFLGTDKYTNKLKKRDDE